ncbi:MAG: hypothetical protein SWX82_13885 [Cyanobacteriota bacterium]|nr:hypothetical protein [Cyanobacteriota bacterium]
MSGDIISNLVIKRYYLKLFSNPSALLLISNPVEYLLYSWGMGRWGDGEIEVIIEL